MVVVLLFVSCSSEPSPPAVVPDPAELLIEEAALHYTSDPDNAIAVLSQLPPGPTRDAAFMVASRAPDSYVARIRYCDAIEITGERDVCIIEAGLSHLCNAPDCPNTDIGVEVSTCDDSEVPRELLKYTGQVKYCAEARRYGSWSYFNGSLEFDLQWTQAGMKPTPRDASVTDELLQKCINGKLRSWELEAPPPADLCLAFHISMFDPLAQ